MGRIDWARAAQFNWCFDNMGGTPLQEAVAGSWQGAVAQAGADGRITLTAPNPGGGQVYFIRGVYLAETIFPWSGFWADPMSGDLTNYYSGGSFVNQGETTLITLGTPLLPETPVQLYYVYLTGEQSAKYEPLNDYPCIRRALRSRGDFTYDFAVDRMLDLMAYLHFAGPVRGKDYTSLMQFLWEAFICRQTSRSSPLMQDSFERQDWDRGAHLMYRGATSGTGAFQAFQTEPAAGGSGRVLHVRAALPALTEAAWVGYGLDWLLTAPPFNGIDRLRFKVQGRTDTHRFHNLTKVGSGSATLVLKGDYSRQEKCRFVVQIQTTGAVGAATFQWSKDSGLTWEASGLISGDRQHPVALTAGIEIYWEAGSGTHLAAGDYWIFWAGEPAVHPRKLLVTLNDSTHDVQDPWDPAHTYVHAIPDRFAELTAFELPFSQFWRRDNVIEDCDRVTTMWNGWYSTTQEDAGDISVSTREETEVLFGDTFYTQRLITWSLSPYATAFGAWAGIDAGRCNSTGHTQVNFLIKPVVTGVSSLTLRVKVKDAQGSYFHRDVPVSANAWQRVTIAFAELQLDSGSAPLTHPLQIVDLGIPFSPPSNGAFYITDLKFGEHLTFGEADRLRTLEFKLEQQGLEVHEWWLDDLSLNLEAPDPYPYTPRLAISLTPYGQNPWRGPTLVHYVQPLAPYLAGAACLVQNYLKLHSDAQDEFHSRYGGVKGPILPVHTRNDVENIAFCGEEDFGRFSWWPKYRNYGRVSGVWHFNGALTDASGNGHTLWWSSGNPAYTTGVCQPGQTALAFDGSAHASLASNADLEPGLTDFSLTLIIKGTNSSLYPPAQNSTYVKATSNYDAAYVPQNATDPTKTLTGAYANNAWISANGAPAQQRLHIDLGTAKVIQRLYYENLHNSGGTVTGGVKNVTIWGSNDPAAFADLVYSHDTGWTQIASGVLAQHVALDQADPHYLAISNSTAYRYYAFKFADNWGNAAVMGVRRLELMPNPEYAALVDKMGADGWVIQTKTAKSPDLQLKVTTSAGDTYADIADVLDDEWHMLTWIVSFTDSKIYKVKDGSLLGNDAIDPGTGLLNTAYINIGSTAVFSLDYFKYERRVLPADEYRQTWDIVRGVLNGSSYPEVGCGLGQYWAFMRLAQYYFVSGDAGAWGVLDNWLTWIDAYGSEDGSGWKLPSFFSEFGYGYGDYDPGQTAAVVSGCLHCYMRYGDSRAYTWARRILDDLRLNRQDPEYGGYKSDRHYGWLNAMVLQAFGLAVNGASGQAYRFPAIPEDRAHFDSLIAWIMAQAGDAKPNVLNADLIPFTYSEAGDQWEYAPNYIAASQMGSLEAVVLMLGASLEHARLTGDWDWFGRLLAFILRDNLAVLSPAQIRSVTAACDQAGAANVVRLCYAGYDRDSSKYCEARDQAAIDNWGEKALDLDFRYGSPVILEDLATAQLLATRLLQRLVAPQEAAEVETWLEGVRLELGDTVALSSDFHGWDREEFTVQGKDLDLDRRRVRLKLTRPLDRSDSWALDAAGSGFDAWGIDQASAWDENWGFRAYVY